MDNIGTILRKLVDTLTGRFLATAAPFIGAGLDAAKGIVNTLDAGVTKFKEWIASPDIVLNSGHITVIVESIKRAMGVSRFGSSSAHSDLKLALSKKLQQIGTFFKRPQTQNILLNSTKV